jgi:tRNA-splicing ligase RtcB
MAAYPTNLKASDLPDDLKRIRKAIEDLVPVGPNGHAKATVSDPVRKAQKKFSFKDSLHCWDSVSRHEGRYFQQIGSLGGGNHFIEVCLDEAQTVWVMLHSGSRNLGKMIAEVHVSIAQKLAKARGVQLPDKHLAWLEDGTPEFEAYLSDVPLAQDYARTNRDTMTALIFNALKKHLPQVEIRGEVVNCHHNYIAKEGELFVTRKGAVRAGEGDWGIIPGSMGTRSYIVTGKGNADSLNSCSHGAGRRMSRGEAKRRFTREDLVAQTDGVECRKDAAVIDEIPGAYKDIDAVMALQTDLVEIRHTLKQVLCVKG